MEVVDMCMLSNNNQENFKKNYDNMCVTNLFVWLGLTNKLSNFDFVQ
jgi:hypothetical protein